MNVLIVDWKNGATFPDYGGAVGNTRLVAAQIFVMIQQMTTLGANLDDIHLIGHSLGAHACGYAGRRFAGKLGRISGEYFDNLVKLAFYRIRFRRRHIKIVYIFLKHP